MRVPKSIKLTLIIIIGLLVVTTVSYSIYKYLKVNNQPNIILITLDALRPDHLGYYGYKRDTSPNIDKLAEKGVKFKQAIAQGPSTYASLPSLLTSTYYNKHRVKDSDSVFNINIQTLPEILKNCGYKTVLISAHYHFHKVKGLLKGIDEVLTFKWDEDKWYILNNAEAVTKRAIGWLKKNKKSKFFLWLHYMDTHEPFFPPPPFNKMYVDDKYYKTGKIIDIIQDWKGIGGIYEGDVINGIKELDYYIAQYDGSIRFTDTQIGLLLKEMKKMNLDKNTIIIITADHGEALEEHNLYFRHSFNLYDELLKVPLIIKYKRLIPSGRIVSNQVGLIDVTPTILDLLGIKKGKDMEGISLLPLIMKGDKTSKSDYVISELGDGWKTIRTGQYKLIYYADKGYELYDLKNDPDELNNLVEVEDDIFNTLKAKLNEWIKLHPFKGDSDKKVLSEDEKEILRSLGYIQ